MSMNLAKTIKLSKARQRIFAEKLCKDETLATDVQWSFWLLSAICTPIKFRLAMK